MSSFQLTIVTLLLGAVVFGAWMFRYETKAFAEGYQHITVITDRWTGGISRCQTFLNGETVCQAVK